LTLNEHYRKLRVSMGDISDWLVNVDVSGFATPTVLASGYTDVLGQEDSFTFVSSTTTCYLPQLRKTFTFGETEHRYKRTGRSLLGCVLIIEARRSARLITGAQNCHG